MPPIETFERNQKAVWWPKLGRDGYGDSLRCDGVELDVRWEWTRGQLIDELGNLVGYDAEVALDREVGIGDLMWLGELADWLGTGSGEDNFAQQMEVKGYSHIPDLDNREVRRVAML